MTFVDKICAGNSIWSRATTGIGTPGLGAPESDEKALCRIVKRDGEAVGYVVLWPGEAPSVCALTRPDATDALDALITWASKTAIECGGRILRAGIPDEADDCIHEARRRGFRKVWSNYMMARATADHLPSWTSSSKITVRSATRDAIHELAISRDEIWRDVPGSGITPDDWAERMIERAGLEFVLVADDGHLRCGYAIATGAPGTPQVTLEEIGVLPAARRRGVGSSMLAEVIRRAAARGAERVKLWVTAQNPTGAVRLYEKFGFTHVRSSSVWERLL